MISFHDAADKPVTVSPTTPLPVSAAGGAANGGNTSTAGNPQLIAGAEGAIVRTIAVDSLGYVRLSGSATNSDGVAAPTSGAGSAIKSLGFNLVFNGTTWDRARGDTLGAYVISKGGANIATTQVAVSTTAVLASLARAGRKSVTLVSTAAFWVGNASVSSTTGFMVPANIPFNIKTAAAVYVVAAGAGTVSVLEDY